MTGNPFDGPAGAAVGVICSTRACAPRWRSETEGQLGSSVAKATGAVAAVIRPASTKTLFMTLLPIPHIYPAEADPVSAIAPGAEAQAASRAMRKLASSSCAAFAAMADTCALASATIAAG